MTGTAKRGVAKRPLAGRAVAHYIEGLNPGGDPMWREYWVEPIVELVRTHEAWAIPIVAALAFGESLAFLSLLIPAWAALVAIGGLIGVSGIEFWPIWLAAAIGAALGDWVSFWFGATFQDAVRHMWPLSRHPDLIPKGEAFIQRFGVFAIFLGRFFGPLRASVPLAAGIFCMPWWPFQFANFTSALVWAGVLLAPGTVGFKWLTW